MFTTAQKIPVNEQNIPKNYQRRTVVQTTNNPVRCPKNEPDPLMCTSKPQKFPNTHENGYPLTDYCGILIFILTHINRIEIQNVNP